MQESRSFRQIRASPFSVFMFDFRMKRKRAWTFKHDFRLWCKEESVWCKREKLKQLNKPSVREILSLSFVCGAYFFEFRGRNLVCFGIAYNFNGKFAPEAGKARMRTAFFTRVGRKSLEVIRKATSR